MKVIIREAAADDLVQIADWIARDNPSAAARMVLKIREQISFLEADELAQMGRPRGHARIDRISVHHRVPG
jgi:plasmid stabilization system protein ParE